MLAMHDALLIVLIKTVFVLMIPLVLMTLLLGKQPFKIVKV